MINNDSESVFEAEIIRPAVLSNKAQWAFVLLPKSASEILPRRGRTTIDGRLNGHHFRAMLEPDGQLSHWLRLSQELLASAGVNVGDVVSFEIMPVAQEPEPEVPADLLKALAAAPKALAIWQSTTAIARLDWIHWVTSAKQAKTRTKRLNDACSMLADGKKRVCCFDPSGYYSKAFSAPKRAD